MWSSPRTLTPIADRYAVELSLNVFTICRGWDSNTQPSACGAIALAHCATAAVTGEDCSTEMQQSLLGLPKQECFTEMPSFAV